jgi:hypothetical protein
MSQLRRKIRALIIKTTRDTRDGGGPKASEVSRKAVNVACSDMKDEQAVERLRGIAAKNSSGAARALEGLSRMRSEYSTDRAYRLLRAAVDGVRVPLPPSESRELFDREEKLGRLPIERAIATLVALEPRLGRTASEGAPAIGRSQLLRLKSVMGPGSDNPDPLVRSNLALSVVSQYLELGDDGANPSDGEVSYFGARRKRVVRRVF